MPRENFFEAGRPKQSEPYPDWLFRWFDQYAIGARTLENYGVRASVYRGSDCIAFPYVFEGNTGGIKFRSRETGNEAFDNPPLSFFGIDLVKGNELTWADDEMSVLAMAESGASNVVSSHSFAPLNTHAALIDQCKKVFLAGSTDKPGILLREEMARRFGRHRCWLVNWPDGCPNARDTLIQKGPDAVLGALQAAQPYPIDGVQRISATSLLALRSRPAPVTLSTGALASDRILKLPAEGRLIIVTGYPGAGKTTWIRFVMVHQARQHGRRWAVFSPEMQPWESFVAECAEVYTGKSFYPRDDVPTMTELEVAEAGEWLSDKVTMLVCDSEDQAPTLDWILERARATVLRDGVTDLLIDPVNEVALIRAEGQNETEAIGRFLQRLKAFSLRHGCNAWVVAHPAKPPPLKPGEKRGPPSLYDLAGSAHYANKTDLGLAIHSPVSGFAEVHLLKARFRRFGTKNTFARLEYNAINGTYTTPIEIREEKVPTSWQDFEDTPVQPDLL